MSDTTIIAWTDHTANFWMGCTKVSEGCRHCYAETLTKNRMGLHVWGPSAPRQIAKGIWKEVPKWNREAASGVAGVLGAGEPHLVFTGSLMDWAEGRSDLDEPRRRMWQVIRSSRHLHFQMLTKRPENIRGYLPDDWGDGYHNVWLGTSIEDMRVAERADHLRSIPAVVRFISYEPALGPLDSINLQGIDWVIQGGESGRGFRDMPHDWARAMKAKCEAEEVAYFFKQSAAHRTEMGIELDGKIVREYPTPRAIAATI